MKTRMRKLVAFALVLAMLLTVMPAQAFGAVWSGWRNQPTWPSKPSQPVVEEPVEEPAAIVAQPEDVTVAVGGVAAFTVATNCEVKKYQWQQKLTKSSKWINVPGRSSDTLEVAASYARNGYQYRCVVTLLDGTKLTSAAAKLSVVSFPVLKKELKVDEDLTVSVDAEKGAFPEGTAVTAEEVDLDEVQRAVDAAANISGKVLYAADITFSKNGEELQPVEGKTVKVSFSAPDLKDIPEDAIIVHIDSETKEAEPVDTVATAKADEVAFNAKKFSIYAVIGGTDPEARANVQFYDKDGNLNVTYIVKNSDEGEHLELITPDPGIGGTLTGKKAFMGWYIGDTADYTINTTPKTIKEVRDYLEELTITEGMTVKVWPMIINYYTITYYDRGNDTVSLGSAMAMYTDADNQNEVPYKVSMAYSPASSTQHFEGWVTTAANGGNNINGWSDEKLYENGANITIRGDVKFYVEAPEGSWLIFDENGKGATYNAPVFFLSVDEIKRPELTKPENMFRNGYDFAGWWYYPNGGSPSAPDANGMRDLSGATEFDLWGRKWNEELPLNTNVTIYAKWTPKSNALYTIIYYTQNLDRNGYDCAGSYVGTGTVGQAVPYSIVADGDEHYVAVNGVEVQRFKGFSNDGELTTQTSPTVTAEGDTVVKLYFKRIHYTVKFYIYRRNGQNTTTGNVYVAGAGRSVSNVNRDGGSVPAHHINNGQQPVQAPSCDYPIQYENIQDYTYAYFTLEGYYGDDISESWPQYSKIGNAGNYPLSSYILMNGAKMKDPDVGDYDGGLTVKGTVSVLDEQILGKTNDDDGNFLICRFNVTGPLYHWRYHIYYEAPDGIVPKNPDGSTPPTEVRGGITYYESDVVVVRSGSDQIAKQHAPPYNGYDIEYADANKVETATTTDTDGTTLRHANFYYPLKQYTIKFFDGGYFNGNGVMTENKKETLLHTSDPITYLSMIDDPNDPTDDDNIFDPTPPEGYLFEGWYSDEGCNEPYTFTTMPLEGIVVYAKWQLIQYRVFLHPNAGTQQTNPDLDWGDDEQEMVFRVDYNKKISAPNGRWPGYKFMGWADVDGNVFNTEITPLRETTIPENQPAYNKSTDYTDPIDKWGVLGEDPINKDASLSRWWITEKLDLYGQWSKILPGAPGIKVEYDSKGGSTPQEDPLFYIDNSKAVAVSATTPADTENEQFLYWVVQHYDYATDTYTDTNVNVYPGATFTVNADDAKIVETGTTAAVDPNNLDDNTSYDYTVTLRAEYGPKDQEKETFFNWYQNWDESVTEPIHRDPDDENEFLQINEGVRIYTLPAANNPNGEHNIPVRPGYKFLGWARMPEFVYDSETKEPILDQNGNRQAIPIYDEATSKANLHIYWVEEEPARDDQPAVAAHYEAKNKAGEMVPVTEVAADEVLPYMAWYAVWEAKPFTVIYTSHPDDKYEIKVNSPDGSADQTIDVLSTEEYTKPDGTKEPLPGINPKRLYSGYKIVMDGGSDENVEWFTDSCRTITPIPGATCYVHEVSYNYLRPYIKYCYSGSYQKVTDVWTMSCVDDTHYIQSGFVVTPVSDPDGILTGGCVINEQKPFFNGDRMSSIELYGTENGKPKYLFTVNPVDVCGKTTGYLTWVGSESFLKLDQEKNADNKHMVTFDITPYWVTPDKEVIRGCKKYTVTIHGADALVSVNRYDSDPLAETTITAILNKLS